MANNKWMDDPILSGISDKKMEVLTKIIKGANGMDARQMLTYFIQESNAASKDGISFTDAETDLILKVLTSEMTPAEIRKVNTVRRMVNMMSKRKGNRNM